MVNEDGPKGVAMGEAVAETPKRKILVVDDDAGILNALRRKFRVMGKDFGGGFAVETANSVTEAVRLIEEGLDPDMIVSDMMMPEKTGKDFLEWLEKTRPALASRLCFLSAGGLSQDIQVLLQNMKSKGRMLDKPFEDDQFKNAIRSILALK